MTPQLLLGSVDSVQGVSPGPPNGFSYTVTVNAATGGTFTMSGIVPYGRALPPNVDLRAAPIGSPVLYLVFGQEAFPIIFGEFPDSGPCPTSGGAVMSPEMIELLRENPNVVFGGVANNTPAPGPIDGGSTP